MNSDQIRTFLKENVFLGDSGLETTLIYKDGITLPYFATFPLLQHHDTYYKLKTYYEDHIQIAIDHHCGFLLGGVGWRANRDWGEKLGFTQEELDEFNRQSISLQKTIRDEKATNTSKILIAGTVGGRDDGYRPQKRMSSTEAEDYHSHQMKVYQDAGADLILANTLCYFEEALGMVLAARSLAMPVLVSFTLELDGKLPSGQSLGECISAIDELTDSYPVGYLVNCVHPIHLLQVLRESDREAKWIERLIGLKGNASMKSHAELEASEVLDEGDPNDFASCYGVLTKEFPQMRVLSGCCGTDIGHIIKICELCQLS